MRPTELNALIASITNQLYCSLPEKDFRKLGIFLSLLSKDMLAMEVVREISEWERDIHK
ncbi:hypothetical protein FACS1894191_7410 [Clostridia bacterium]|nr:hypothetical protein FACS1894191_7410 [Clostridia bacterium]